jgi:succinyl-diaminopimelate desuccinylase
MPSATSTASPVVPVDEIVELTRDLVRIPSRGGEDDLGPILDRVGAWLTAAGLPWEPLFGPDDPAVEPTGVPATSGPVGILARVSAPRPGPVICLDATVDTASTGRLDAWRHAPFSAAVEGRRLFGRGAADSKIAVAIFGHVARAVHAGGLLDRGTLYLLFDGDEHTGRFGGVRAFVEGRGIRPSFVAVGYPGPRELVIGARGFYRATVHLSGTASHSGEPVARTRDNAILKLGRLVDRLTRVRLPREVDADFRFGPRLTVTEVSGGGGWSQVPSAARASVDVRLTPHFGADEARALLGRWLARLDRDWPSEMPSRLEEAMTWPCYRLDRRSPWVRVLRECAREAFGRPISAVTCGPSNIGNYLAARGIPAVCGFGVGFGRVHAADEFIELDTIAPVYRAYLDAVRRWSTLPGAEA